MCFIGWFVKIKTSVLESVIILNNCYFLYLRKRVFVFFLYFNIDPWCSTNLSKQVAQPSCKLLPTSPSPGHVAVLWDTFDCCNKERGPTLTWWVETKDAADHPVRPRGPPLQRRQLCRDGENQIPVIMLLFSPVQLLSGVWFFATPWTAAPQASLSITDSRSLLRLMSIQSVMPSNYLILCCPLLLLPSVFPSIRVFSDESVLCIRWPNY